MRDRPSLELLTDQPIKNKDGDKFGRDKFVNAIAEIIHSQSTKVNEAKHQEYKNVEENLIIGLYGEWGFGKSSIINLLDQNLQNRGLLTVYFNPWLYGHEDQIIISLFNVIVDKCGLEGDPKEKLIKLINQYYPLVSALSPRAGKTLEASKKIIGEKPEINALYCKEQIDRLLSETANPLTIFIDDVDRLSRHEIHTLFKTLRLIASFKHVIYVVACDSEMVAKSIKENYADGSVQDGRAFMEKIIQIPIHIPQVSKKELLSFALAYINELIDVNLSQSKAFELLFDRYFKTPRDVKRFVNSFIFTFNLLKEEIPAEAIIVMELIRTKSNILWEIAKIYYRSIKAERNTDYLDSDIKGYFEISHKNLIINKGGNSTQQLNKLHQISWQVFGIRLMGSTRQSNDLNDRISYFIRGNKTSLTFRLQERPYVFHNPNHFIWYMEGIEKQNIERE